MMYPQRHTREASLTRRTQIESPGIRDRFGFARSRTSAVPSHAPATPQTAKINGLLNAELLESQIHAVPGRCDYDLVDGGTLRQIANEFDALRQIFRL
jgi:hypothetical protein